MCIRMWLLSLKKNSSKWRSWIGFWIWSLGIWAKVQNFITEILDLLSRSTRRLWTWIHSVIWSLRLFLCCVSRMWVAGKGYPLKIWRQILATPKRFYVPNDHFLDYFSVPRVIFKNNKLQATLDGCKPKLRPPTDLLTGMKCRATSVAKNEKYNAQNDTICNINI